MKRLSFILLFLLVTDLIFSQKEVNYFFDNNEIDYGFFLGPEIKVAPMIEGYQVYSGIKAAMIFNERIAFGLAGGGFVTETVFEGLNDLGEEGLLNTVMARLAFPAKP